MSKEAVAALSAIERYRYLSVHQVAVHTNQREKTASEMLLRLERAGLLSHFGNVGIRGYGKTPKLYFLTKRGYAVLAEELDALGKTIEPYKQVHRNTRWSPLMFHRLATLDVLAYLERDCRQLQSYRLIETLVEYRREKIGRRWRRETTDFVADPPGNETRIVPDAGFVLDKRKSCKRALFLIEVDLGTTRLSTDLSDDNVATYTDKLARYDQYLASGRAKERYASLGEFAGFHLLTVTTSNLRIENIRRAACELSPQFHHLYRFSALTDVRHNFLHDGWLSRDHADPKTYSLIRGK